MSDSANQGEASDDRRWLFVSHPNSCGTTQKEKKGTTFYCTMSKSEVAFIVM